MESLRAFALRFGNEMAADISAGRRRSPSLKDAVEECVAKYWANFWRDDPEGLAVYQARVLGIEQRFNTLLARRSHP